MRTVKGWLASDGEARFGSTGLRDTARPVGGGADAAGAVTVRNSAAQPKKGRGAGEGCTAAITGAEAAEAGVDADAEQNKRQASTRVFCNGRERRKTLVPKPSRHPFMVA